LTFQDSSLAPSISLIDPCYLSFSRVMCNLFSLSQVYNDSLPNHSPRSIPKCLYVWVWDMFCGRPAFIFLSQVLSSPTKLWYFFVQGVCPSMHTIHGFIHNLVLQFHHKPPSLHSGHIYNGSVYRTFSTSVPLSHYSFIYSGGEKTNMLWYHLSQHNRTYNQILWLFTSLGCAKPWRFLLGFLAHKEYFIRAMPLHIEHTHTMF